MPDTDNLINVIDAYEANSYGGDNDGGELSRQRSLALRGYAGENLEPQPEGRSQVVDWTVFETIQWILPSLTRIFAAGDDIVEFDPEGPEDEDAAEQESQFLNYLVTRKNNWFLTCLTWFQDALLTKNAYCMAYVNERLTTEVESYEGQSEDQIAMILQDKDLEVVDQEFYPDPDHDPQPELDPQTGEPMVDLETGTIAMTEPDILGDIRVRRTKAKKELSYRVLPPERCRVDANCPDFTLADCDYFEFRDVTSISSLRADGYEVNDDVGEDGDHDTLEDNARDDVLKNTSNRDANNNPDKSTREVEVRYVWARHDYDEDGIAELIHVRLVGKDVLVKKGQKGDGVETVTTIPVASIVPFLNTHRHIGNSVADLTFDIQRIKTAILRQGLDSLYFANNPRPIASNKVEMDDLLVHEAGSPIRVDSDLGDVGQHVAPYTLPFIFPQAQEGLRHMDTVTESRVGVNKMFQGIDESNANDHNRVGQLSTMAAQRVEQIARLFGHGVERLFQISHEIIIKSGFKADKIRLTGKWVEFDPSQWKTGRDMRVVAPFAAGNKDSLIQRLMIIASIHEKALSAGAPFVQIDDAYELAKELSKAADLPDYKFFTDPKTVEPAPPPPDYTMMAVENERAKIASDAEADQRKNETEQIKLEFEAQDKAQQRELDKYEVDLRAEVELIKAGAKEEGMQKLEALRASLKNEPIERGNETINKTAETLSQVVETLSTVTKTVQDLQEAANAPVKIVRKDGKIIGKEVNGKFIAVS